MMFLVGVGIFVLAMLLSLLGAVISKVMTVMAFVGFALIMLSFIVSKAEYEERELVASYKVLPIMSDVYAIKTCDNKVIFKYVDDEDNKVLIDILGAWKEIVEIPEGKTPVLDVYKQKQKLTWRSLPALGERYIEVLRIPEGSIVTE